MLTLCFWQTDLPIVPNTIDYQQEWLRPSDLTLYCVDFFCKTTVDIFSMKIEAEGAIS